MDRAALGLPGPGDQERVTHHLPFTGEVITGGGGKFVTCTTLARLTEGSPGTVYVADTSKPVCKNGTGLFTLRVQSPELFGGA